MMRPRLPAAVPDLRLFHTRGLATLITTVTVVAALGLVAYWGSALISPGPVAVMPVSVEAPRSSLGAEQGIARLFGVRPGAVDANVDGVALTGVFAPQGGSGGFATFRTAKGGAAVTTGQEIIPGLRLERVEAGRVVISANGRERVLELPKARLGAPSMANTPTVPTMPRTAGAAGTASVPGASVNREE